MAAVSPRREQSQRRAIVGKAAMERAIDMLDETETIIKRVASLLSQDPQRSSPGSKKRPPATLQSVLQKLAQSKAGVKEAALSEIHKATQSDDAQAVASVLKRLEISERRAREAALKALAPNGVPDHVTGAVSDGKDLLRSFETIPRWFQSALPTPAIGEGVPKRETLSAQDARKTPLADSKPHTPVMSSEVVLLMDSLRHQVNLHYHSMTKTFLELDTDRSGAISKNEMATVLQRFQVVKNSEELNEVLSSLGLLNDKDEISYSHFMARLDPGKAAPAHSKPKSHGADPMPAHTKPSTPRTTSTPRQPQEDARADGQHSSAPPQAQSARKTPASGSRSSVRVATPRVGRSGGEKPTDVALVVPEVGGKVYTPGGTLIGRPPTSRGKTPRTGEELVPPPSRGKTPRDELATPRARSIGTPRTPRLFSAGGREVGPRAGTVGGSRVGTGARVGTGSGEGGAGGSRVGTGRVGTGVSVRQWSAGGERIGTGLTVEIVREGDAGGGAEGEGKEEDVALLQELQASRAALAAMAQKVRSLEQAIGGEKQPDGTFRRKGEAPGTADTERSVEYFHNRVGDKDVERIVLTSAHGEKNP